LSALYSSVISVLLLIVCGPFVVRPKRRQ